MHGAQENLHLTYVNLQRIDRKRLMLHTVNLYDSHIMSVDRKSECGEAADIDKPEAMTFPWLSTNDGNGTSVPGTTQAIYCGGVRNSAQSRVMNGAFSVSDKPLTGSDFHD